MKINIPDIGNTSSSSYNILSTDIKPTDNISLAQLAVVGDPPDAYELIEGSPFKGANYKQFYRLCAAINLSRGKLYLTNCVKSKLQHSMYGKVCTEKGYRCPEFGELQLSLLEELSAYKGKVIIASGFMAMTLLLDSPKFDSVTKYRGSIYSTNDFTHLKRYIPDKYIIITYSMYDCSPRMNPLNFYMLINDYQKAINLSHNNSLYNPDVNIIIEPTYNYVLAFLNTIIEEHFEIAIDIEATPQYITCIAIANENDCVCIPFMNNSGNYWSAHQEVIIWNLLSAILNDPNIPKIAQNGMFDFMFILRTMNIKTQGFVFDTMLAQHLCWTDLPKGLDFLTSVYTFYPYYKDDGKQSHLKAIKDWPLYWEYNAKDAIYLHEIKKNLTNELKKFNVEDHYNYIMNLHAPLMEMEYKGILTDQKGILKYKQILERKIHALQHGLNKLSRQELNTNSSKQMIAYFYGHCMIKPYVNRRTGNATCDAVALSRIARKKVRGSAEAKIIMKMRGYHKLLFTYFKVVVDKDNRLRCTYKIGGTVTGRLSSESTYFGTGTNLQNQPPIFKQYLLADPDHILIEIDEKQAEAHAVSYMCEDANMMNAFETGIDVHTFNASKIFNIPMEEVTKTQRQMGKKVVHASNYRMGPQTFSDNLAKDEIYMSKGECKKLLDAYDNRFPNLKRWHRSIEDEVSKTRILYNLFGRPKKFLGMLDRGTFGQAYSYKPQSTIAELLNRGMVSLYYDIEFNKYDISMLATVHDSILIQVHKKHIKELYDVFKLFSDHLSYKFTYKGRSFTIGLDAKIGFIWGNCVELKNFKQETINDALNKLNLI